ncbi:MAG: IS66 family transposase [Bdellovibrionales bacterium]|nr:IS66 family transposase [Bdellovibrionales bacterium]
MNLDPYSEIERLNSILRRKEEEINGLRDIINLLQRKKYASQSEVVDSKQLGMFNELEDIIEEDQGPKKEKIKYERSKKRRTRIPDSLPRIEKFIDLPDEEKVCPHDGSSLKEIGEEISEQLEIIPAKIQVIKTIRKKYACPCCDEGLKTAPHEAQLLPKTMATPSLIAYIIIAKFADALPLYRQEVMFARIGALLTRQSMARWLIDVSNKLIPLYNLLEERLLEREYVQMDETRIQALKEDGKKATSKSYMWVRHAPGVSPIVLYDYDPSRSGSVPLKLLDGFKGYLQADGYDGYEPACNEYNLIRLGCMDHCRRKFHDAFKTGGGKGIGKKALVYFKKLYKIEDQIKDYSPEKKKELRDEKSRPILEEMKGWIDDIREKITPSSVAGKAITYAFNEWKYLIPYLDDGNLNISNSWVENKIRPFCVGRKNWLFSTSVDGANASAILFFD